MPLSLKRKEYQYSYSLSPGSELDEKLHQIEFISKSGHSGNRSIEGMKERKK